MHCNYCGNIIDKDDVVREQRLCFDTDNDKGELLEVSRFVVSATCGCGSITEQEYCDTTDLCEFYDLAEIEENNDEESDSSS